jgi:hypothetical protein
VTDEARYADRFLALTETAIIFGVGEGRREVYQIFKVTTAEEGPPSRHVFHYNANEGGKLSLEITYTPGEEETIQLQNNKSIWKKSAAEGTLQ